MTTDDVSERLAAWFAAQLPDAEQVRVEGLESVDFGHSAETLLLGLAWRHGGTEERREVVVRVRPPEPGLLPPYDLHRQFRVLRALEATPVPAPSALWHEPTGEVLGRELYVMSRCDGEVIEQQVPAELAAAPERVRRRCESYIEHVAAIHSVDLDATGLGDLGDGTTYLDRELDHWTSEIRRLQRAPLPALERLASELRRRRPEPCPRVTLVHGDPKPGNFGFVGDEVGVVYDWELAQPGDPLADIGWVELMWAFPVGLPTVDGAPTIDELLDRWCGLTGIALGDRAWYRAFQGLKMAVINLSGSMLFDAGHSDDLRFALLGHSVPWITQTALQELGLDPDIEPGPVVPREERVAEVTARVEAEGARADG